jgi:inosine/xanthosine triphosphatase
MAVGAPREHPLSAAAKTQGAPSLGALRCVRVGSANGPKIQAVRDALAPFAPRAEVVGAEVASGVPDQPVGFAEIARGARNRAQAALASGPCDLAVGYEDGLVEIPETAERWWNVGCAAVVGPSGEGLGFSSGFAYPPALAARAVAERAPIGDLFDAAWRAHRPAETSRTPSALSSGNIGKLTSGALPRADYARHAVLCALVSFFHPDLYRARGEQP